MLTPNDLNKIKKVVRNELELEIESLKTTLQASQVLHRMHLENKIKNISDMLKDSKLFEPLAH